MCFSNMQDSMIKSVQSRVMIVLRCCVCVCLSRCLPPLRGIQGMQTCQSAVLQGSSIDVDDAMRRSNTDWSKSGLEREKEQQWSSTRAAEPRKDTEHQDQPTDRLFVSLAPDDIKLLQHVGEVCEADQRLCVGPPYIQISPIDQVEHLVKRK